MRLAKIQIYKANTQTSVHDKCNTLPISEEKAILSLFRSAMGMDNFVEEFLNL